MITSKTLDNKSYDRTTEASGYSRPLVASILARPRQMIEQTVGKRDYSKIRYHRGEGEGER